MKSPLVDVLEEARSRIAAVADGSGVLAGETAIARRLSRDLEQAIARLRGEDADKDLISIVCHDLKDPLASIVMGAGFLKKAIPADDGSARRVIDAIARSAERMSLVIGDFHDLAKLDTGRLTLDRRACDVSPALRTAVDPMRGSAAERGVRLELELPEEPLHAVCDRHRIAQIVGKLVGNALRFTPSGGSVTVGASPGDDVVRVTVKDTGRGIAPERLASIFDHAANARRSPRDGPGLSLAIVKGVVELHGGDVAVESHLGAGSAFTLTLPAASPAR